MGKKGAQCVHTFSDVVRGVDKSKWDKDRTGMVCTESENFADMKAALLKLCSLSGRCEFPAQSEM